ncbi:MAG TPA: TonB-dependent receptor [Pyrinomonadaceae bacterium]|jgi:hypothetical protein
MPSKQIISFVLCGLLALLPCAQGVRAQRRAAADVSLRVTVYDPSGAVIVGARVELSQGEGAAAQTTVTDERGVASFARLAPGRCVLRVAAAGFEPQAVADVNLRGGANSRDVRLEVANVNEEVSVAPDKRESKTDPRGDAFSNVLTPEQIEQLPDDPDEMEQVLQQMAGPGATIRVNGFRGGRLPPKSQIRQIRFQRNPYAAEFHEEGFRGVDILTKPGTDLFHASLGFGFRDEALSARPAFAPRRAPEQSRRVNFSFELPLWRNRTSLFVSGDSNTAYDSKTILAALPDGPFNAVARRPARTLNLQARVEHALTKTHTLNTEYQRNAVRQDNLGVGDFSLFDRAYTSDTVEHLVRAVDSGTLHEKLVNEVRFQARWQSVELNSASDAPAVQVLNAFTRGGAGLDSRRRVSEYELGDNIDFAHKQHTMRAGLLGEVGRYRSRDDRNANGTFTFASLAAFNARRPTTYTQRSGDSTVAHTQYQFGAYWQDDWRARKNLTLSGGVRYEWQNHLRDRDNFAPRAGLAWSPFKNGRTTLRGGAGLFFDWFDADAYEQTLRVGGTRQRETVIRDPGFPDPFASGSALVLPATRYRVAPDLSQPYVAQASAGLEQELLGRFRLMSEYRYRRGVHLLRGRNVNAPVPGLGRPEPASGNVIQVESSATSTRHEWNVGLGPGMSRLGGRAFWFVNYTLAKTTNDADGAFALPADNYDLRGERGPAANDIRHRFFAMYDTRLWAGFRVANFFNVLSATPYTITTGGDDNGDTDSNDRPAGVTRNSARGAAQWNLSTRLSWRTGWGKPRAAAGGGGPRMVAVRIDGSGGSVSGLPGGQQHRWNMEFYAQVSNLLNHTNPVNYTGVLTSPFFGQPVAALPGRRVETGVRFNF